MSEFKEKSGVGRSRESLVGNLCLKRWRRLSLKALICWYRGSSVSLSRSLSSVIQLWQLTGGIFSRWWRFLLVVCLSAMAISRRDLF